MRCSASRPSEPAAVRAFLAAALDRAARERLRALTGGWTDGVSGLRPVPVANAHVTLRFLGSATPDRIRRVALAG